MLGVIGTYLNNVSNKLNAPSLYSAVTFETSAEPCIDVNCKCQKSKKLRNILLLLKFASDVTVCIWWHNLENMHVFQGIVASCTRE